MNINELNDTAHKILDAAQAMVMTEGFNAFSYKDLQNEVGVKTSSIHYYFPTKQDLAFALVERHNARLLNRLEDINKEVPKGIDKIKAFGESFINIAGQGKFCLCGMLTSDLLSMSDEGTQALKDFFFDTERWLADAIRQGIEEGDIKETTPVKEAATNFLATLEGGILIARARKGDAYMRSVVDQALMFLKK